MDDKEKDFLGIIAKAINDERLVLFIGAGASMLCGLPSWGGLADTLLKKCYEEKLLTFEEKEKIKINVNSDYKKLITYSYQLLKNKGKENIFFEILKKSLTPHNETNNTKRFLNFVKDSRATILTTNADSVLHNAISDENIYSDLSNLPKTIDEILKSNKSSLIHLHGHVDSPETLVFTTPQYLQKYRNDVFTGNMEKIFNESLSVILFIGYGLSELELLQYFIVDNAKQDNRQERFMLNGCYDSNPSLINEMDKEYYQLFGIDQISYSLTEKGYDALLDTLEEILNQVRSKTILVKKELSDVISMIGSDCNETNKKEFLRKFSSLSRELQTQVLRKLEIVPDAVSWLKILMESESINNVQNISEVAEITDKTMKLYKCDTWPLLTTFSNIYLRKENKNQFGTITDELINKILKEFESNEKRRNNYKVTQDIVKIITNDESHFANGMYRRFEELIKKTPFFRYDDIIYPILDNFEIIKEMSLNILKEIIEKVFEYYMCETKQRDEYVNTEFLSIFSNNILSKDPTYVRNLIDLFSEYDKSKIILDIGAFYDYPGDDIYSAEYLPACLANIIKYGLDELPNGEYEKLYLDISAQTEDRIYEKISIYMVTKRYALLNNDLWEQENPFNSSHKYADLCYLIDNNINDFEDNQLNTLKGWLSDTNFGLTNPSDINLGSYKYEIFKLMKNKGEILRDIIDLSYIDEYEKMEKFYHKNKILLDMPLMKDENNYDDMFDGIDSQQVIEKLNTIDTPYKSDLMLILNAWDDYLKEYNNLEGILKLFLTNSKIPEPFLISLIQAVNMNFEAIINSNVEMAYDFLTKLVVVIKQGNFENRNSLYYSINALIKERYQDKDDVRIDEFLRNYITYICTEENASDATNVTPYYYIQINPLFEAMTLLIKRLNVHSVKENSDFIKETLTKKDYAFVIKYALTHNIIILKEKMPEIVGEKLEMIFDNMLKGVNFSYAGLYHSLKGMNKEYFDLVKNLQSFDEFINTSTEDSALKTVIDVYVIYLILEVLVELYVSKENPEELIKKLSPAGILKLLRFKNIIENEEFLGVIVSVLSDFGVKDTFNNMELVNLIIRLLEILTKYPENSIIIDFVVKTCESESSNWFSLRDKFFDACKQHATVNQNNVVSLFKVLSKKNPRLLIRNYNQARDIIYSIETNPKSNQDIVEIINNLANLDDMFFKILEKKEEEN